MVGADDATFAKLKPVLAAFCENIVHAGPAGHGIVLKLINNFIAQAIATATAEACAAAAKSGLSLAKLHELISAGAVNSGIFQMMVGKMLENNGDLTGLKFTLVNAMKDLRYYTHFAESLPVSAIVGEAVHQSLVNANLLGFGDKYVASLIEAQEKLNGVEDRPASDERPLTGRSPLMKLLVLGGTRFLGRHLVDAALARGDAVTVFTRGKQPNHWRGAVTALDGNRDQAIAPGCARSSRARGTR